MANWELGAFPSVPKPVIPQFVSDFPVPGTEELFVFDNQTSLRFGICWNCAHPVVMLV